MATGKHRLTARTVETLKKPGHHADGHGLYLIVRKSGSKSWSYIWIRNGRRREMGLGGLSTVSLALAREKADIVRKQVGAGLDPIIERAKEQTKSFGEVADKVLSELEVSWTNPKHGAQWKRSLNIQCQPIRNIPINQVETSDVLRVLKPVWISTPETGRRLRSRIERVLDYAHTHGWRSTKNAARWKGHLESVLVPVKSNGIDRHFTAMPYADIPKFLNQLKPKKTVAALALEFTILTAARTGEILGADWSEIDFENKLWAIPSYRMKAKQKHVVPLSDRAMEILYRLSETRHSDFVFPGTKPHKPMSNMSMAMILRRMKIDATVHGFRSSFRDYCGDQTSFPREVAESALAHKVGNSVEQAYRRRDALDKRRQLMNVWSNFCSGKFENQNIVAVNG